MTSPASIRCAGTKGGVALEPHQGPAPGQGGLIQGVVTSVDGDKTRSLGTLLTGDDRPGPVLLDVQCVLVPGEALG